MDQPFDYHQAFSRNLGWIAASEQERLRQCRVAIAGMGGVGGSHLLTLARLGIGRFTIAEPDAFEQANFNRQVGAMCSTVGRPKLDVLRAMALDINPELALRAYPGYVTAENVDEFLEGADLYVDSLDFFAFAARKAVFAACARKGIPAVTVAPLGFSAALMTFLPGRMTFEEYFRWDEAADDTERAVRFAVGISPRVLHIPYLVEPERVNLKERRGPSTGAAVQLCAGVAAAEAAKILLGRGRVRCAPWGMQFDPFRGKMVWTWRPGGNHHPLQRLIMAIVRRRLRRAGAV